MISIQPLLRDMKPKVFVFRYLLMNFEVDPTILYPWMESFNQIHKLLILDISFYFFNNLFLTIFIFVHVIFPSSGKLPIVYILNKRKKIEEEQFSYL